MMTCGPTRNRRLHSPGAAGRSVGEVGTATTVTIVLLFPVTAIMLFAGVQTVLWQHARTISTDRANQTAAAVAAGELTPATGQATLTAALTDERDLRPVRVDVETTGGVVTVTVVADAPGILIGTRTRITVRAATPIEAWQTLP